MQAGRECFQEWQTVVNRAVATLFVTPDLQAGASDMLLKQVGQGHYDGKIAEMSFVVRLARRSPPSLLDVSLFDDPRGIHVWSVAYSVRLLLKSPKDLKAFNKAILCAPYQEVLRAARDQAEKTEALSAARKERRLVEARQRLQGFKRNFGAAWSPWAKGVDPASKFEPMGWEISSHKDQRMRQVRVSNRFAWI